MIPYLSANLAPLVFSCSIEHSINHHRTHYNLLPTFDNIMSQHHPKPPPISHLHAIADHRVAPEPFELPSYQSNNNANPTEVTISQTLSYNFSRGQVPQPPTQPGQRAFVVPRELIIVPSGFPGANSRARQPAVGPQPHRIPGNSAEIMPRQAVPPTVPGSYIAEISKGNVGDHYIWNEAFLAQLVEFERLILRGIGEKGKAFWKLWVDLQEPGLSLRDKEKRHRFMARGLRAYPWYKGDESVEEAVKMMRNIDELYKTFAAKKYAQHVHWVLTRPTPGVTVMDFLEAAGRQRAQAQAQAPPQ
ncbi:hypothetical protein B0F90DRAFT_1726192 [Multifurca ochricompacta]|uniref:Uncharacterized protein n=1 Tax=Multifurca ochricompacta TaxID=376703 RepID=A0AAD4M2Q7_9AGAM|nr:hypothetical protein B0F90DRAFT_1726192 [Multifurca ochricompacta]